MKYTKKIKKLKLTLPESAHNSIQSHFSGDDYRKACWIAHKIYKACWFLKRKIDSPDSPVTRRKMPMSIRYAPYNKSALINRNALQTLVVDEKLSADVFQPYTGSNKELLLKYDYNCYRWDILSQLPFVAISSDTFSAVVGKDNYKRLLNDLELLGIISVFVSADEPVDPTFKPPRIYLWSHDLPEKMSSENVTLNWQDNNVCFKAHLLENNALVKYQVANPNVKIVLKDLYRMHLCPEFVENVRQRGTTFLEELFASDYDRKALKKYYELKPYEKKEYSSVEQYKRDKYFFEKFISDIYNDIALWRWFEDTPCYGKHKFISTCKGQRIYSPLTHTYSGLRGYVRTPKIKKMASIDLKSSIPTILAEHMHRAGYDCEYTRLIADHQEIYEILKDRLALKDRNEAKLILNTRINSWETSTNFSQLKKAFPEAAEYIINSRNSFEIPDWIREDIRRWDLKNGKVKRRGNAKIADEPETPYQQYYLLDKRGFKDGAFLWENTISHGSFAENHYDKHCNKRTKRHLSPINIKSKKNSLTYRELFTFESKLMQKIVARIKWSDVGRKTDVLLLHDAIYFDSDYKAEVKEIVENVVMCEFRLCIPIVEVEEFDGERWVKV